MEGNYQNLGWKRLLETNEEITEARKAYQTYEGVSEAGSIFQESWLSQIEKWRSEVNKMVNQNGNEKDLNKVKQRLGQSIEFIRNNFTHIFRYKKEEISEESRSQKLSQETVFFTRLFEYIDHLKEQGRIEEAKELRSSYYEDNETISGYTIDLPNLSDEVLIDFLEFANQENKKDRDKMEKLEKKWKKDFTQNCKAAIQAGWLPLSEMKLKQRVNETKFILNHNNEYTNLMGAWQNWTVEMSHTEDEDEQQETAHHELIHGISGRNLVKYSNKEVGFKKIGLAFTYGEKEWEEEGYSIDIIHKYKLDWLNEAITERLAKKLDKNYDNTVAYVDEQWELQKMIDAGIDEQLFINAFFEDYDHTKPVKERIPATRKLFKTINKVMGYGHLKKVENELREYQLSS